MVRRVIACWRRSASTRVIGCSKQARRSGIRDRHAALFLALAENGGPELKGPDLVPWLRRLKPELDNFRLALEWYLERDPEAGLRLANGLEMYGTFVGSILSEGYSWVARLMERAGPLPDLDSAGRERIALYARALVVQGRTSQAMGQFKQTRRVGERAATLARHIGDREILAMALGLVGFAAGMSGDNDLAEQCSQEVLALTEDGGSLWDRGLALMGLMQINFSGRNDIAAAARYREQMQQSVFMTGASPFWKAQVEWGEGMFAANTGDPQAAARHLTESNRIFRELDLGLFANTTYSELAHLLRREGDLEGARAVYRETIRAWQTTGSLLAVAHQLESFAYLAVAEDELERAVRLLGAATALRESVGGDMLPYERVEYDSVVESLRQAFGAEPFDALFMAGRALGMNAAVAYALE